jgi:predicted transcriptional regulator
MTMYSSYIMKNASELSRTQIYLTQQQQARLAQVSKGSAATKSALIRQAIDMFLARQPKTPTADKTHHLQSIAGLWAQRDDLEDPAAAVRKLRQPRFTVDAP